MVDEGEREERPGRAADAGPVGLRPAGTVLAVAGSLWWAVATGAVVQGVAASVAWVVAGVVAGTVALWVAVRWLSDVGAREVMAARARAFWLVNVAQVVGILVVVVVAGRAGVPRWIPVGIAVVFALHFLPFAVMFRWRGYTWLALALLVVGAAGAVLAAGGASVTGVHALVGPAVAVVLWVTVLLAAAGGAASRAGRGSVGP